LAVLCAVLLLCISHIFASSCIYTTSDGQWNYDFSNMNELNDLISSLSERNRTYYYEVCSPLAMNSDSCKDSAVCIEQADEDEQFFSGGLMSSAQWSDGEDPSQGVTIVYSQGDLCGSDNAARKTVVKLNCYISQNGPIALKRQVDPFSSQTYISYVNDIDECATEIIVQTPFACPTNRPADPTCANLDKASCLEVDGCYCGWCADHCLAYYELCDPVREVSCYRWIHHTLSWTSVTLYMICFVCAILSCCTCIAACIRKRQMQRQSNIKLDLATSTETPIQTYTEQVNPTQLIDPQLWNQQQYYYIPLNQYPNPSEYTYVFPQNIEQ